MTRARWPLWQPGRPMGQPPNEKLETIADIVAARWNAAKTTYRESSLWASTTSWTNWLRANVSIELSTNVYHLTNGGKLIK